MPAIVIGDHRDSRVAKFGLARELCFGQIRHADHVEAQLPVGMRFRQCGKLRTFHADVRPAAMRFHARALASITESRSQLTAHRMVESDMCDDSIAEKSRRARTSAIEKLIGN